jgi:acetyltransferase-like isoleucine patch superfamily enzyme
MLLVGKISSTLIHPGATIGEKVIVGTGAVVVKNITEAGTYVGGSSEESLR